MLKGHDLAHIVLTVSDITRTKKFYEDLFQTKFSPDNAHSFSLTQVGLPCWFVQWHDPKTNDRFSEKRIGLDHVAFELETLTELEHVIGRLDQMQVPNAGLEKFADKYPYVAFRDPDNIQVEFFISKP